MIAVLIDNFIKSVSAETQAILPSIMTYIALYSILFLHTITRVEPKRLTLVFAPTNCPIQKDIQEEEEIRMAKMVSYCYAFALLKVFPHACSAGSGSQRIMLILLVNSNQPDV